MPRGMASSFSIYDYIGQHYYIHMYMIVIIWWWGNTELLLLHPLPFTKDVLPAKALMLSTAGINAVFVAHNDFTVAFGNKHLNILNGMKLPSAPESVLYGTLVFDLCLILIW